MKKIFLSFIMISSFLKGQKSITVTFDTIQIINWPLNLSLKQAQDLDQVSYANCMKGEGSFKFDLVNRTFFITRKN